MKVIPYLRVSTRKQEASGLGLEAQQAAIDAFCARSGAEILRTYIEVETGKRSDRPQLAAALKHAKRAKATLVVAKLDRLSRNVAFLSALMESKVDFVACDQPNATPLSIHILAAVAEDEVRKISERTKSALAAYKARGGKLGSAIKGKWDDPELNAKRLAGLKKATDKARESNQKLAKQEYEDLAPYVIELRESGKTLAQIAEMLNAENHKTRRGSQWTPMAVKRVLDRFKT